ncbi:3-oxoacyl-ACP synthase [Lentzea aerocolonigenes]|uniref:Beta-ketoacyl-[acyl-carrier-protein] synthase III n=1 Tax=Lentzea aerocolonigenes TaxID=68170 RepID=A0A0F0H1H4_LENAE|nr:beta-ketoacyl-ACP synthase III [Lentzea aerocolonigenes]KJK48696.1 3-oxoacyl-ACP synthase [Lentzea aerocolonigenes]
MTRAAVLCGLGSFVPPTVVDNDALSAELDTSDQWIRSRTGISQRHIASGLSTSDLAVRAGREALKSVEGVDALVLATSTPDRPCPATAPAVAAELGLGEVAAFDVAAVCTGFVYALANAAGLIATGVADRVLVIGADTFSTILDPADRTTRAIFGDGAGAVVLRAGRADEPGALQGFQLGSDGSRADLITQRRGGYFEMSGREVFTQAVLRMAESVRQVVKEADWELEDVTHVVAHQANIRILHAVADQLGLPRTLMFSNLDRVGNTVAASIPLALADARLPAGAKVVLTGFGGGLTWGSTALTWPVLGKESDV